MMIRIPARRQLSTAWGTPSRGGARKPSSPGERQTRAGLTEAGSPEESILLRQVRRREHYLRGALRHRFQDASLPHYHGLPTAALGKGIRLDDFHVGKRVAAFVEGVVNGPVQGISGVSSTHQRC